MDIKNEYEEISPPKELECFVKHFWFYKQNKEDFKYSIIPDGCFDLIFDFEYGLLQNIYLTGIWTSTKKITVTKGTTLLAIRFKLISSETIFKNDIKKLLNTMIILPLDFWSQVIKTNLIDFNKFTKTLSVVIKDKIIIDIKKYQKKLELFNLIYDNKIFIVREIAQKIDWNPRQINRYFNNQYGFPIKQFLMIVRCQNSYKEIANGNLYPSNIHADQAHFIKEIKRYTEATPKELYKNKKDRFIQLSPLKKYNNELNS